MNPCINLVTLKYDPMDSQYTKHPLDVSVGFMASHTGGMEWFCYWYYQIESLKGILEHETSNYTGADKV